MWSDNVRKLCYADANAKHGNAGGLPVNLKGVTNGSQFDSKGNGALLTVSVLGTRNFDLSKIDLSTVRAGDAAKTGPVLTPLDKKGNGDYQASIVDLNGDGILDLMLHFNIPLMVDNKDITATTTKICVYGEGPGWVLNGCGIGGGGSEPPPPPPPPPAYDTLPECPPDIAKATGRTRCAILQAYGWSKPGLVNVKVLQLDQPSPKSQWPNSDTEADSIYPRWLDIPVDSLVGPVEPAGGYPPPYQDRIHVPWMWAPLPFGNKNSGNCTLTGTPGVWGLTYDRLLVRADITIPPEAENVQIQVLVDDLARVYVNGYEVTPGWKFYYEPFSCASYATPITLSVPASYLRPGINKIGVWADDAGAGSNYLDFRVFGTVPIWP
jgi:hypothetical protein